jgi:phosphatidylserine/phosphatidylglycerophosphate/cardiolipin synthase-like enzyme
MGRRYYTSLLASGVRIFEYQPRFLHAKVLLCDHWTSMGSSNVDRWNFRWNLEANQEIDDAEFARAVQARFELDLADCREIVSERWARRPWDRHVREWFWGKVESLLAWFSYRKNTKRPRDEDP